MSRTELDGDVFVSWLACLFVFMGCMPSVYKVLVWMLVSFLLRMTKPLLSVKKKNSCSRSFDANSYYCDRQGFRLLSVIFLSQTNWIKVKVGLGDMTRWYSLIQAPEVLQRQQCCCSPSIFNIISESPVGEKLNIPNQAQIPSFIKTAGYSN